MSMRRMIRWLISLTFIVGVPLATYYIATSFIESTEDTFINYIYINLKTTTSPTITTKQEANDYLLNKINEQIEPEHKDNLCTLSVRIDNKLIPGGQVSFHMVNDLPDEVFTRWFENTYNDLLGTAEMTLAEQLGLQGIYSNYP